MIAVKEDEGSQGCSFIHSPLGMLQHERDRFNEEVANPDRIFITYRGLRRWYPNIGQEENTGAEGYLDVLPKLGGKDLAQLVNEKIEERELTDRSPDGVRIVDVGYGKGKFLLDCRKEWGSKIQIVGYGTDVYTKVEPGIKAEIPPTDADLIKASAKLVEGNVVDIRTKLDDNFADFIVSSNALMYVSYPQWELVKKIYRVLKPGGIALLDYGMEDGAEILGSLQPVFGYLKNRGYVFEAGVRGLAFRKTNPDINVPIWTSRGSLRRELKISSSQVSPLSGPSPS